MVRYTKYSDEPASNSCVLSNLVLSPLKELVTVNQPQWFTANGGTNATALS